MKEKKNGEGEGGKYFKKENIMFYRGEEKWRRKVRNIFGEGKGETYLEKENIFVLRRRKDKEKEENTFTREEKNR